MSGDNPFDSSNPFNSGAYEANPFADASGGGHSDGAQESSYQSATAPPPKSPSSYVPAVNPEPVKQGTVPPTRGPQAYGSTSSDGMGLNALEKREKELERRTAELKRREDALTKGGAVARVKNFPKFYPIVYHSIEDDIPDDKQQTVKMCFYCYLGLVLCLFWNWFSATACMFAIGKTIDWLYSCIYLLTGVPGAWYLWYKRIYTACRGDAALTFMFYFVTFSVHCAFCIWASFAPGILGPKYAFTGLISMISMFDENGIIGFFYLVGFFLWAAEAIFSTWVMKITYALFRGSGAEGELKAEATKAAASQIV